MPRNDAEMRVEWKISIPASLAARVEMTYLATGGKPRYGARSALIAQLLEDYLSRLDGFEPLPVEGNPIEV